MKGWVIKMRKASWAFLVVMLFVTSLYSNTYALQESISVESLNFVDMTGAKMRSLGVGEQVLVQSFLTNNLLTNQRFAYIVQITDSEGIVVMLAWMSSIIPVKETIDVALSWIPDAKGTYKARAFVWQSLTDPTPLSLEILETSIIVNGITMSEKPMTQSSAMDYVDHEILVVYASTACSNESALELIGKKASEAGNIALAYLNSYGYQDKGFTYTWQCYQLPIGSDIESYEIQFNVKENQLSIALVPNDFFYEGMEHACAFVDFQEWSIWLTQICSGYGSGLSYDITHELSHWILFMEYPTKPEIFVDWVHDTQDCYDSGYGCQDLLKVGNNAYTVMPKYKR